MPRHTLDHPQQSSAGGSGWNIWRNAGGRIAPISTHGYGGGDYGPIFVHGAASFNGATSTTMYQVIELGSLAEPQVCFPQAGGLSVP